VKASTTQDITKTVQDLRAGSAKKHSPATLGAGGSHHYGSAVTPSRNIQGPRPSRSLSSRCVQQTSSPNGFEHLPPALVTVPLIEAVTVTAGSLSQSVDGHTLNYAVDRPRGEGIVWRFAQCQGEVQPEQLSAHHEGQG
jgi:hypothetical protein